MSNNFKFGLSFFFIALFWGCSDKYYIIKVQVFKDKDATKGNVEVGLLLTDSTTQNNSPIVIRTTNQDHIARFEKKDLKNSIKRRLGQSKLSRKKFKKIIASAPLLIVCEKSGSLFFEGLDTIIPAALSPVRKKTDENKHAARPFFMKEKKIQGKVYLYDQPSNGQGRVSITVDGESALVDSAGNFKIRFENKEKKEWDAEINFMDMSDYLDTTYQVKINRKNLEGLELKFKPIPKLLPIIEGEIEQINSNLEDIQDQIKELEKKRDKLPGLNRHAAYTPIDQKIIYLRHKLNSIKNRFENLKNSFKAISDKIIAGKGDPNGLLKLGNIQAKADELVAPSEEGYVESRFWDQYYEDINPSPTKITGQLFWSTGDYKFTELPSKGKEKLNQIIWGIQNLREHPYNKDYKDNNDFCIYINIECSADRQPLHVNDADYFSALDDLISNYKAKIIDEKNATEDIQNYRLSVLRGYELFAKIIEDYKDNGYHTVINFHVFGCSKANLNSLDSPDDRYALITYWVEPTNK